METTRVLRSSMSKEDRDLAAKKTKQVQEAKLIRPYITYKGRVKYCPTFLDCAMACDELLKIVNDHVGDTLVIGFDMEWPFSFQTGPGKTAVIQISPNLGTCYILHVSALKSLPTGLTEFLQHPKTRITGVNIKNDGRKLARDFAGFDSDKLVEKCIDTGVLANTILPLTQRWSMEKLVNYVLEKRINKNKKVRMSRWHVIPLTKEQQIYAAIDAYASLLLYIELQKRKTLLEKEQDLNQANV